MDIRLPSPSEQGIKPSFKRIWEEHGETYPFEAIVIDDSRNANDWAVPQEELEHIASQLKGLQLRLNHSRNKVEKVVGGFDEVGEIYGDDKNMVKTKGHITSKRVAKNVHQGYVKDISLSGSPDSAECSMCGKSTLHGWECDCDDAYEIVKGMKLAEGSIVTDGAYEGRARILGFAASMREWQASKQPQHHETTVTRTATVEDGNEKKEMNATMDEKDIETKVEELERVKAEYEKLKTDFEAMYKSMAEKCAVDEKKAEDEKEEEKEEEKEDAEDKEAAKLAAKGAGLVGDPVIQIDGDFGTPERTENLYRASAEMLTNFVRRG